MHQVISVMLGSNPSYSNRIFCVEQKHFHGIRLSEPRLQRHLPHFFGTISQYDPSASTWAAMQQRHLSAQLSIAAYHGTKT